MKEFSRLKLGDCLNDPEKKKHYNKKLFSIVAPHYNFVTRALSICQDATWKKKLINALPDMVAPRCLDIATGTGDLAFALAKRYPKGQIFGIDITQEMIDAAKMQNKFHAVKFVCQDMCALEFKNSSCDIITGGYALRNAPDLEKVLSEAYRILKPNGIAAFLDFSKPTNKYMQYMQYGLLKSWGGMWGLLVHANPRVYSYIADSLWEYPDYRKLHRLMLSSGFDIISSERLFFGMLELLVLKKC